MYHKIFLFTFEMVCKQNIAYKSGLKISGKVWKIIKITINLFLATLWTSNQMFLVLNMQYYLVYEPLLHWMTF